MMRSISSTAATIGARPILRAVVFDMDGTLTIPNLDFKEMYNRCGVPMNEDILVAITKMNDGQRDKAVSIIEEMEAEGARTLQLGPGVAEMARWLQAHKIPMALVTRNTAATVTALHTNLWESIGLQSFHPAISRDDPYPAKPNPEALYSIAKTFGINLPTDELLMVGDSPSNDIVFGKAAGVTTVLVDSGRQYLEESEGKSKGGGADIYVEYLGLLPRQLWERYIISGDLGSHSPLHKFTTPVPDTLASMAAVAGNTETLQSLSFEDCNAPDTTNSNTPLIWAASAGNIEAVVLLLNKKVSIDTKGYIGATACSRASRGGHREVLKVLLEASADVNIPNDKMQYPLHFAAFKKHPEIVKLLLDYSATNLLVLDRKGRTPAEDTSDESIRDSILQAQRRYLDAAL